MISKLSNISDIKIVHSELSPSGTISANSGISETITPTVPTGYKLLTHLMTWNTGVPGIIASFDMGGGILNAATLHVYQYNTKNITLDRRGIIHLLSAYYK